MSAAQLAQALAILPRPKDKNLLVGVNTADDAGVYKISANSAVVYTVDILTPVVRSPYLYGKIVAANSISDIYAMGGDPKLALNIIGFPDNGDPETLGEILRGGHEKAQEAGVTILGGHTFVTKEIKYGLSVIGYIHPDKIITNAGAKPGDVIVLTKPIGSGLLIQAVLVGEAEGIDFTPVVNAMTALNRDASLAMRKAGVNAATDITGFGLIGHLVEMAEASRVGIELDASRFPIHKGALEILGKGVEDPGITMNLTSFDSRVDRTAVDESIGKIIFSSETSGGLAIALPEKNLEVFRKHYTGPAPVIGRVTGENAGQVIVKDRF
ncbi:MAG TPA: selenide, water dikinase SelD [candidate division WOR-3 bacterium]|uniref:Selenide, water dikinase SelD n=1 Tax=candidate division WOR-3 bacterium TaxID=2052148 RepID=A0A9C9JZZ8_UNCW3|nr:selenide, water dikinase SelD [candidate division WOR-3 bacterium]